MRKWTLTTGVQYQEYNQELYEGNQVADCKTSPYIDYLVKLNQKKSLRSEFQYMSTMKILVAGFICLKNFHFATLDI